MYSWGSSFSLDSIDSIPRSFSNRSSSEQSVYTDCPCYRCYSYTCCECNYETYLEECFQKFLDEEFIEECSDIENKLTKTTKIKYKSVRKFSEKHKSTIENVEKLKLNQQKIDSIKTKIKNTKKHKEKLKSKELSYNIV